MARTRPPIRIRCPRSSVAWLLSVRARPGDPSHLAGRCPSCGAGLHLCQRNTGLVMVHHAWTAPAERHEIVWTEP